jgi:hypothetical protein
MMSRMTSGPCGRTARFVVAASLIGLAASAPAGRQRGADEPLTPQELGRIWDTEHVSPPLPPLVDHAEVVKRLDAIVAAAPDLFAIEKIGESMEGRSINSVRVGAGPFGVLLWSQMHGDEPSTQRSGRAAIVEPIDPACRPDVEP